VRFGAQAIAIRLSLGAWLRRRSLPELLGALTTTAPRPAPLPAVEQAIASAESILERIPVVPDTCLYRALARYGVLRSAGYPARFVMAINPASGGKKADIAGHAWVELDGEPYGETVDPDLVVTYSYPGRATAPTAAP
jgi:hypothetical protein